jgi:hypothetical protein
MGQTGTVETMYAMMFVKKPAPRHLSKRLKLAIFPL